LIVGLLINSVAYAAIFIVVALLLSRSTTDTIWRSFLVLFLFIAAGVTIEALANRLFEQISEIEQALVERCIQLLDQAESIKDLTSDHWRLRAEG
jgi:hypothetical protein